MMRAAIVFAFSEIMGFALWYIHALPTTNIVYVVLGGIVAGVVLEYLDTPGKPLEELRKEQARQSPIEYKAERIGIGMARIVPSGLGSDAPAEGGQSNTALLVLMKAIEREIDARMAADERAEKSDEIYDEPMAMYPQEMRI